MWSIAEWRNLANDLKKPTRIHASLHPLTCPSKSWAGIHAFSFSSFFLFFYLTILLKSDTYIFTYIWRFSLLLCESIGRVFWRKSAQK